MHELGITQGIIDRAREAALAHGARRVTDLYLAMTPAADFTQESIEMYFEMLAGDDPLFRGARLHFEMRPAAATCVGCRTAFEATAPGARCPRCGSDVVTFDPAAPMVQLTDVGIEDEDGAGEDAGAPGGEA